MYIAKAASILRKVANPADPRLDSLRKTDDFGFTINITAVILKDGWVVIVDRSYPAPEDPPAFREFFEHRVILFKDSDGRLYAQTQGMLPPEDVNNKGEDDFGVVADKSTAEFKDSVKKGAPPNWSFLEIGQ